MASPKWTPEQKQQALNLYTEHGPGHASRETGIPSSTITSWAHRTGVQADAPPPGLVRAQEAAALTAAQKRSNLAAGLLEDAERIRAQLFAPTILYSAGGKEHGWAQISVDQPPFDGQLQILRSVDVAVKNVQLLMGEATSRPELVDRTAVTARLVDRLDEFTRRREEKATRKQAVS